MFRALTCAFLVLTISAPAQTYPFKHFGIKTGFPSSSAFDIIQSKHTGHLWIATLNGLVRFDGSSFEVFTKSDGLPTNRLRTVFEDSKGRLWIGTFDVGFVIWDGESMQHVPHDTAHDVAVNAFYQTDDGEVFFAANKGLFRYNEGEIQGYVPSIVEDPASPYDLEWFDGKLWIATVGTGLLTFDPATHRWEHLALSKGDSIGNDVIYSVTAYRDDLWVGHWGGMTRFNDRGWEVFNFIGDPNRNRVRGITFREDGRMWLSTYGAGLILFDPSTGDHKFYGTENGLSNDFLYAHIEDGEGNIWTTSEGGGLSQLPTIAFSWWNLHAGLEEPVISDVLITESGDVWLGSLGKGIYHIESNATADNVTNLSAEDGLANSIVFTLSEGSNGELLVGTNNRLFRYKDKRFSSEEHPNEYFNLIYGSRFDAEANEIWLSTIVGLWVIGETGYRTYWERELRTRNFPVTATLKDRFGNVWLSAEKGIAWLEGDSIKLHEVYRENNFDYLMDCTADYKGNIWMCSAEYLYFIEPTQNPRNAIIRPLPIDSINLPSVLSLAADGHTLWLGTDLGLGSVDLEKFYADGSLQTHHRDQYDGYMGGASTFQSMSVSDGNVWWGTDDGLMRFNLSEQRTNPTAPRPLLRELLLFGEYDTTVSAMPADLELSFKQNHLTFRFSAVSFTAPDKLLFSYKLEGVDEDWSTPSTDRRVTYSSLAPGNHTFQLKAANSDGIWSEEPFEYSFTIHPPFWKTWWFQLLIALGFAIILFAAYRLRVGRIKRDRMRQIEFSQSLIQTREEEQRRLAGELHDSIGQDLLLVQRQLTSNGGANKELVGSVTKTLDDVRQISRNLHPYQLEKLGLTKSLEGLIETVADSSGIFITHELAELDGLLRTDGELHAYRIVQESLNNIIKHSGAKAARVVIKRGSKGIQVIVKDNGRGFNKKERASFGLRNLEERVKMLGGSFELTSQKGKGTELRCDIPLQVAAS